MSWVRRKFCWPPFYSNLLVFISARRKMLRTRYGMVMDWLVGNLLFFTSCVNKDYGGFMGRHPCHRNMGLKEYSGCPDSDMDGGPNDDHRCPKEPGVEQFLGCPRQMDGRWPLCWSGFMPYPFWAYVRLPEGPGSSWALERWKMTAQRQRVS